MNPEEIPRLDAAALRKALPRRTTVGREILVFEETGSTNDLAKRAGDDGVAEGLVIFAESQTAGRGTQGRRWSSPPRCGLWFSVLLRPTRVPVERWPELTFCAALAVAETTEIVTGQSARIKWPNDVLLRDRKVAGILLECHHRQPRGFVVIGIGLNVLQREEEFAPELRDRAGSLAMMLNRPAELDRGIVAATALERLEFQYDRWQDSLPAIMADYAWMGCVPPSKPENAKGGSV